jgi:hypothetical protein
MSEPAAADVPALEGYDGPARLVTDGQGVDVEVRLRGQFQPLDGRYHWYGRVTAGDDVDALVATRADLLLRTPHGDAEVRLADRDPWGRYRVTGTGRPPFPV